MDEYAPPPRNYYPSVLGDSSSYKYRLEGRDIIREITDTLKGGVKSRNGSATVYYEERRLMNDLGIERVKLIVQTGVNKVNHLTKYPNEDRILKQMQSIMSAFIYEITLNAKAWAPKATFTDGVLFNPTMDKIKNKELVINMVENAIFQSMQRGSDGFEASLTAKSYAVNELIDNRQREQSGSFGFFSGLFRRNKPPEYGGYG